MTKKTKRVECGAKSGPGQFYQPHTCVLDAGHTGPHVGGRGLTWSQMSVRPQVPSWVPVRRKVKAIATGHVDLAMPGKTIDGVEMYWGDLFLAPRQDDQKTNGVYIWIRPDGVAYPVDYKINPGDEFVADRGTCHAVVLFRAVDQDTFVQVTEYQPPPRCEHVYTATSTRDPRCTRVPGHAGAHETSTGDMWYEHRPQCDQPNPRLISVRCVRDLNHAGQHRSAGGNVWDTADHLHLRGPRKIAMAWHDTICPEGEGCRDRYLHSIGENLVTTGMLERFLAKMAEMR